MNFTWDVNPATLLSVGIALVAVIKFWLTSSATAAEAKKEAEACMKCAREAHARIEAVQKDGHTRIELLQAAIHAKEITQAERLVSREVLREVENRLAESIERLGDRLDNLLREMVTHRRGGEHH